MCVTPVQMLRVSDEITGTKCWLTHGSPSHTGMLLERYRHLSTYIYSVSEKLFSVTSITASSSFFFLLPFDPTNMAVRHSQSDSTWNVVEHLSILKAALYSHFTEAESSSTDQTKPSIRKSTYHENLIIYMKSCLDSVCASILKTKAGC